MVGPDWGACDPENPRNRRRRVAIAVELGATRVLVDTPPELREQCLDAAIDHIDGVIYTHAHADHSHGIDDLRGFNIHQESGLPVFADTETLHNLKERFGYAFDDGSGNGPKRFWYRPRLVPNEISGAFSVGSIDVSPFVQQHGRNLTLGLRFGAFAYSTDVDSLSDQAFDALQGIDTWLVDCIRYNPSKGHAHLELTLSWIHRLKPRRAILTHMSKDLDYEELLARLPKGVEPAYDGMVINVPDEIG